MPAPKARRQHRVTISDDMGPVWEWFKEVPPKAAAGEIEFLLRLGVLAAARVRGRGSQAAQAAESSAALPAPAPPAVSPSSTAAPVDSQASEAGEPRVEQAGGWNFLGASLEAAGAGG